MAVALQEEKSNVASSMTSVFYQMMPYIFVLGFLMILGKFASGIYRVIEDNVREESPPKVQVSNVWEALRQITSSNGWVYLAVSQGCNYCPIAYALIETAEIPVSKIIDLAPMRNEEDVNAFIRVTGIEGAPALVYVEDGEIVYKLEFTGDVLKDAELVKKAKELF